MRPSSARRHSGGFYLEGTEDLSKVFYEEKTIRMPSGAGRFLGLAELEEPEKSNKVRDILKGYLDQNTFRSLIDREYLKEVVLK